MAGVTVAKMRVTRAMVVLGAGGCLTVAPAPVGWDSMGHNGVNGAAGGGQCGSTVDSNNIDDIR